MSQFILLRGARQLLTLQGSTNVRRGHQLQELGIIEDGSVLIRDGIVFAVASTRRIENMKEARGALDVDVHGSVVMPGFIDPSLHATLQASESSPQRRKKTREVYEENLELMRSCLQHGTLTAEIKASGVAANYSSDISVLRQLAKIGDHPVGMVRTWKIKENPESAQQVAELNQTLDAVARRKLARFVEVTVSDKPSLSEEFLGIVRTANLAIKVAWAGSRPEFLEEALRCIHPRTVSWSSDVTAAEAVVMARYPGMVMFSPGNEIGRPIGAGTRKLIDSGGAIALCSGYDAAQAPGFSMQMAISLAVVRGQLSVEEAITAATVNAAFAVGQGNTMGVLAVGRRADILVLTIPDYREIPRQFGINQVGMALRGGNIVFNRSRWRIGAHEPVTRGVRTEHL